MSSVDVAFIPGAARPAAVGIAVDVIRATSTIVTALASGYERVVCCRDIDEAHAIRAELGEGSSPASATRRASRASTRAPRRGSSSSRGRGR